MGLPFEALIEASLMLRYLDKLLQDAKFLTNLDKRLNATIKLLGSVTS